MCFFIILHNIRSALNVGSIFRTADAVGVDKIYLSGYTPTPEHPKVTKTALGAQDSVAWKQHTTLGPLLSKLKKNGVTILALEQHANSRDIFTYKKTKHDIALLIGNEVRGINTSTLKHADYILEIPMRGKKESLNVAVATGIALYQLTKDN